MGWKNWPYWLKGGVVVTIIAFSIIIIKKTSFIQEDILIIILYIILPTFFMLGALIGGLINNIKRKSIIKIIIVVICIYIISLFIYKTILITGTMSGTVTNALTGEPVDNMTLIYEYDTTDEFFGGEYRTEVYFTNKDGIFEIPGRIYIQLLDIREGIYINIVNNNRFSYSPFRFIPNWLEFENFYNKNYFSYKIYFCDKWCKKQESEKLPNQKFLHFRESRKNLDIKIMPRLNDIKECEKSNDTSIKNDCIEMVSKTK